MQVSMDKRDFSGWIVPFLLPVKINTTAAQHSEVALTLGTRSLQKGLKIL